MQNRAGNTGKAAPKTTDSFQNHGDAVVLPLCRLQTLYDLLHCGYRDAQESVNLNHSLVLTGIFIFKPSKTGMSQLYALRILY